MDSDNYMRWVQNRLLPTFEAKYPGKKMVLIQDNAPYHHKRELGSLHSLSKQQLFQLVQEKCPEVKHIKLPASERRAAQVTVEVDESVLKKATKKQPNVPNVDELRDGIVSALRDMNSPKIECKVEALLYSKGHRWIWTPPYCPWLQPVSLRIQQCVN
jgi:hypothetical protein